MRRSPQQLHHFKASEIQAVNFGAEELRGGSRAGQDYSGWIQQRLQGPHLPQNIVDLSGGREKQGASRKCGSSNGCLGSTTRRLQFFFFCFYSWKADRDNLVICYHQFAYLYALLLIHFSLRLTNTGVTATPLRVGCSVQVTADSGFIVLQSYTI